MKINNELIKKYKELVDYIEKDVLLCDGIAMWEGSVLREKIADLRKMEQVEAEKKHWKRAEMQITENVNTVKNTILQIP